MFFLGFPLVFLRFFLLFPCPHVELGARRAGPPAIQPRRPASPREGDSGDSMEFGCLNVNRLTHLRTGRLAEIKAGEVMEAAAAASPASAAPSDRAATARGVATTERWLDA